MHSTAETQTADPEAGVRLIAETAALKAANELRLSGYDSRAEGPDVLARKGKTSWRLINRVTRSEPGMREKVLDQFAACVANNIVSRPPSTARQS